MQGSIWQGEEQIVIEAPAHVIWARLSDVQNWREWNNGIEWIEIRGPFQEGTEFTMKPPGEEPLTSRLTKVVPSESFTDETLVDDVRVEVEHTLTPLDHATEVCFRTRVFGPDAEAVGLMVSADFLEVLSMLKAVVEEERE